MSREERDPMQELLRYVLVAGGMVVFFLVLTRGKWLTAALIGVWLFAAFMRLKRAAERD